MKNRVLLSALSSMVLASCAMSDDGEVIADEEPGVEAPGSSDTFQRTCGTQNLSLEEIAFVEARLAERGGISQITPSHVIPVHFHVIHRADGSGGAVTTAQINNQIAILNAAF